MRYFISNSQNKMFCFLVKQKNVLLFQEFTYRHSNCLDFAEKTVHNFQVLLESTLETDAKLTHSVFKSLDHWKNKMLYLERADLKKILKTIWDIKRKKWGKVPQAIHCKYIKVKLAQMMWIKLNKIQTCFLYKFFRLILLAILLVTTTQLLY